LTKDERFNTTAPMVKKIRELEANPTARLKKLEGASRYILDNFNVAKVGSMWESLINAL
jgi:hypothetical protein